MCVYVCMYVIHSNNKLVSRRKRLGYFIPKLLIMTQINEKHLRFIVSKIGIKLYKNLLKIGNYRSLVHLEKIGLKN